MTTFIHGTADLATLGVDDIRATGDIFHDVNWGRLNADPAYGNGFATLTGLSHDVQNATAGTANFISGDQGFPPLLELDSASSTDNQGVQVQFDGYGAYLGAGGIMRFEVMLRAKDIATGPQLFLGAATPYATDGSLALASGALAAPHWVGFYITDDGSGVSFGSDDNSAADSHSADVHTLIDGATTSDGTEWVRLGFRWEYNTSLEFYVNGVAGGNDSAITAQPEGTVVPTLSCLSAGTTDPLIEVAMCAFAVTY